MSLRNNLFLVSVFSVLSSYGMQKNPNMGNKFVGAAARGELDKVQAFISAGVDIHHSGDDALMRAAASGRLEVVKLLLKHGAKIQGFYKCALTEAAKNGHEDVVQVLIEAGANIHDESEIAILIAAFNHRESVVQLLLKSGVDINVVISRLTEMKAQNLVNKTKHKEEPGKYEEAIKLLIRCNEALQSAANQNTNNNNVPKAIVYASLDNKKSSME